MLYSSKGGESSGGYTPPIGGTTEGKFLGQLGYDSGEGDGQPRHCGEEERLAKLVLVRALRNGNGTGDAGVDVFVGFHGVLLRSVTCCMNIY